jgi:hypothetical protein
MRIETDSALTLAAVIQNDLAAIKKLEEYVGQLLIGDLARAEVDSVGFALHNLYNALENSFTQISLSFENHVRDQTRWHRELLEKMFLDLGALRPAVLEPEARALLADLLGFRHIFRHAYELTLDEAKTVALWKRWQREGGAVVQALAKFAAELAKIGAAER